MNDNYFHTRPFTDVIEDGSKEPDRRKIGGVFLYENTSTYFFSRTNYGKSILAFQFAYAAATGTCIAPCNALMNECEPMKVLFIDLEMDSKTIFDRYRKAITGADPDRISNLVFLHERIDKKVAVGFELLDKIERAATDNLAKLIVIDNISKLLPDSLKAETVTMVITALNRIREKTGASFLVIGHTTKGLTETAILPTSYYGSSMVQNFFTEIFYLDTTKDGKFFLAHAKTKREECYNKTVPVFTRGEHPRYGVGFTYESLQNVADIQLPTTLTPEKHSRKVNLSQFREELFLLDRGGIKRSRIAEIFNVSRSAVSQFFEE
jgi:RecA-family ATPase